MGNLVRRQLQRHWVFLLACALVMGGFEFLICAMVGSSDTAGALGEMTRYAPPLVRVIIEQYMPGGAPVAVLAFGWNHPVAHALLSAVAIVLGARAIAGEVENGAIELVLAQPIARGEYFTAHLLFAVAALSAVIVAGLLGTVAGQQVYALKPFGAGALATLFANMLLLQLAIYSLTLLVSAFGREAGRVAVAGVLLAVVSFLVNVIATLWSKAQFVQPYSLHHYFDPSEILVRDRLAGSSLAVLAAVAAIAVAAAYLRFRRRDLP